MHEKSSDATAVLLPSQTVHDLLPQQAKNHLMPDTLSPGRWDLDTSIFPTLVLSKLRLLRGFFLGSSLVKGFDTLPLNLIT